MAYAFVIYLSFAYSVMIFFNVVLLHNLPAHLGPMLNHFRRLLHTEEEMAVPDEQPQVRDREIFILGLKADSRVDSRMGKNRRIMEWTDRL